jgi:hypothetical protein
VAAVLIAAGEATGAVALNLDRVCSCRTLGPAKDGRPRKKLVLFAEEIRAETFAVDASDPVHAERHPRPLARAMSDRRFRLPPCPFSASVGVFCPFRSAYT